MQQSHFELRDGLSNSRWIFEQTGKGRVAFLGGSITEMRGWRELICAELQRRFPKTTFDFINAGVGSMDSTPAAFRMTRDVFKNGPVDLLFEEAAVNDWANGRSDEAQVRAMEGIVRHARTRNPSLDILLMHFVDPDKMNEYNEGRIPKVIQNHEKVAVHYGIPSLDLALEVTERIRRGEFTWKDDFKDLHPSPFGHRIYCDAIGRLLDAAWSGPAAKEGTGIYRQPEKLDKFCYDRGRLISPDQAQNLEGFRLDPQWRNTIGGSTRPGFVDVPTLVGEKPGDRFEFSSTGSAVGLFVAAGPDAGVLQYQVDGGEWKTQDLFTRWSEGLHIPWLFVLEPELKEDASHRLVVVVSSRKNERSRGHSCRIVNFAVNDTE
jgi:lysophospholipase L1-like esterase